LSLGRSKVKVLETFIARLAALFRPRPGARPNTTAGVSYSGQFADGVQDNAVKGRFAWLF